MQQTIAFIGGGNMASAIIGGLLQRGHGAGRIVVVEPLEPARQKLQAQFGVGTLAQADATLQHAGLIVWAVKPQLFRAAAQDVRAHTLQAVHLSVAAGIRSASIAAWLENERVVRSMPNTPALIGKGISALFARDAVSPADRELAQAVLACTGDVLWLTQEEQLDAVTALSGSGPAYMFYFMEAMRSAGSDMGLDPDQAYQLAVATCIGAGELARASSETPEVLRERVTSKGGTTYAALTAMEASGVKTAFMQAMHAARQRARELGDEFGG